MVRSHDDTFILGPSYTGHSDILMVQVMEYKHKFIYVFVGLNLSSFLSFGNVS